MNKGRGRVGGGIGLGPSSSSSGTPNHYESAAGAGVVGGSGLKDYTRIGEGGGALLALRERDYHSNNQQHAPGSAPGTSSLDFS